MDKTSARSQPVTGGATRAAEPGTPAQVPRPPTPSEWAALHNDYPNLVQADVWVTGEPTSTYNCIAFSLGYTDRWIDPNSPLAAFQVQYQGYGFAVANYSGAKVDGWGAPASGPTKGSSMKHGSRLSPDPQFSAKGLWESKLGGTERITHGRDQLTGTLYGNILTSFTKAAEQKVMLPDMEPELTAEERRRLRRIAADLTADDALSQEFSRRREAFLTATASSRQSRTAAFTELPEFTELTALGERIVPLVIAQLDDPGGFFLLAVLDALDPSVATVDYDPMTGLQSRARRVARAWLGEH